MMEIQEIEEILQQKQNPHRYRHTIGVRYTSICLAMRYGEELTARSICPMKNFWQNAANII